MAAGDLTTLANLKAWIPGLTGTSDDLALSRLISATSAQFNAYLSRSLLTASYTESYDGKDTASMILANFPITAVSSLSIDGIPIPAAPLPTPTGPQPAGYVFTAKMLSLVGGGYPFGASYRFTRGYQNVQVAYTAGLAAVPFDIEQACIEYCAIRYSERQRIGQKSKSLGGEVVSFFAGDLTPSVKLLLAPYRRVAPR